MSMTSEQIQTYSKQMGGVKNTGLVESLSITSELQSYSMLSLVNKRSAIVDALELLRRSEKAIPTCENKRSTVAEVAGQPCRAMTDRLKNFFALAFHQSRASHSVSQLIWGSARQAASSSSCGRSSSGNYRLHNSVATRSSPTRVPFVHAVCAVACTVQYRQDGKRQGLPTALVFVHRAHCCLLFVQRSQCCYVNTVNTNNTVES